MDNKRAISEVSDSSSLFEPADKFRKDGMSFLDNFNIMATTPIVHSTPVLKPLESANISIPAIPTDIEQESDHELLRIIARSVSVLPAIQNDLATVNSNFIATNSQVSQVLLENKELKMKLAVLEGKHCKLEDDFCKLKMVVTDIQCRQMNENVLLYNIDDTPVENCVNVVTNFFKKQLKIPSTKIQSINNQNGLIKIDVAHRNGKFITSRKRSIVVKFVDRTSKLEVFKYVKNLKGTDYSVSDQLPAPVRERRIAQLPLLRSLRADDKKCKLIADKIILEKEGIVDPEFEKGPKLNVIGEGVYELDRFTESDMITDRGSTFKGYATRIEDFSEASIALSSLYQDQCVVKATHRIYCYNIDGQQGWSDDGEFSAGSKLAAEINKTAEDNYFICVTRHYGGTNLGKARFDHIIAAGKDAYARL